MVRNLVNNMLEKIKTILSEYTDTNTITESSMLEADLGLSSLDLAFIIGDFEDAFNIEVADRDIPKFACVKDIIEYLEKHSSP